MGSALDPRAEIQERKLTVVPHNSWQVIGSASFVSLNKELNGVIQSSGAIKILNFPLHPLIGLIFKLEYRGTCHLLTLHSIIRGLIRKARAKGLLNRLVCLRA